MALMRYPRMYSMNASMILDRLAAQLFGQARLGVVEMQNIQAAPGASAPDGRGCAGPDNGLGVGMIVCAVRGPDNALYDTVY
ncbi:MAG TPA: hypothetical protein VEV85_19495 [Bryobacteraceae bacterium]|nr:hypothetical protein [Bryobacteraceae bacterium]